ncbi:hypothetical protein SCUCBS95973_004729 [Sporothrix curviconia]|uniref:Single-strand DNA deaminase toxin A-like C-terminal domain-containing protein n=1 Tax=Sporothrix curviconia TaxID=1260050 RepID=A0ABP0BR55_9PEZI
MSSIQATPACIIAAGQKKPLKICTSGWRKITETNRLMLDGERWTELVRSFADKVGFHLHHSIRDTPKVNGRVPANDGRYFACHAEKKMKFANIGLPEALKGKLMEANLPLSRRRGRDFLRCIRHHTGIDVRTASGPVFSESIRKRTFCSSVLNKPTSDQDTNQNKNQNKYEGDSSSDEEDDAQSKTKGKDDKENGSDGNSAEHGDGDDVEMADEADALEEIEAILETFPVGNVARPCTPVMRPKDSEDGLDENHHGADNKNNVNDVPLPVRPLPSSHVSVRSSPSPSISLASVLDSSVVDRRDLYPIYTSPTRCGGTAAPPSIWGDRSKPPVTPCLEAPELYSLVDMDEGESAAPAHLRQSYFFGTPSAPSERSVVVATKTNAPVSTAPVPAPPGQIPPPPQPPVRQTPAHPPRNLVLGSPDTPIVVDDGFEPSTGAQSAVSPTFQVLLNRAERQNRAQRQKEYQHQQQRQLQANLPRARSSLEILSNAADTHHMADTRAVQHRPFVQLTTRRGNGGNRPLQTHGTVPVVDLTDDADDHIISGARIPYTQGIPRPVATNRNASGRTNTTGNTNGWPNYYNYGQVCGPDSRSVNARWFPSAMAAQDTDSDIVEPSSHSRPGSNARSVFASPASQAPQQRPQPPTPVPPPPPRPRPTAASRRRRIAQPLARRGGRRGRRASPGTRGLRPFPDLSTFIYDDDAGV